MKKYSAITLAFLLVINIASGRNNPSNSGNNTSNNPGFAAGCSPGKSSSNLELNNVRALIHTGGDMWWDLVTTARYEIPKNSGKHSLFAGALWLGGQDVSGQLKIAGQMFRSDGVEYWTGPLSKNLAEIDFETCAKWDKHYVITRPMVDLHAISYGLQEYTTPDNIINWPAHGDVAAGEDFYLAPFFDQGGDGTYNPEDGDYPNYDLTNAVDCKIDRTERLYGDSTLWWIFNDKGNIHTRTGGAPIGMEIHAQAFAFATNDEINNMTFYNYRLFNRSTYTLTETYFGVWTDADLGYSDDDFVGCDVMRGLGYCYNGVEVDGSGAPNHYGVQPPSVGIDFFEGPYQDNDGVDNGFGIGEGEALNGIGYGDSIIDNERFGMRRFIYFNRSGGNPATTDPEEASHFYNYLRGIWKDGSKMLYGGTGHFSSPGADPSTPADFMFPGNSDDTYNWGTQGKNMPDWSEETEGNIPLDRRFVQSAGPFVLLPGAVNDITVGVVWARAISGGPMASVEKLRLVDDKAQALFENCFRVLNGPDAPDVAIKELSRELILTLANTLGNNKGENYIELDPTIPKFDVDGNPYTELQRSYVFEGYQIFQLRDNTVSPDELYNPDRARLVAQVDKKNGVTQLVNFDFSDQLNASIPSEKVNGQDNGIAHSFRITTDLFAAVDKKLVNHKTYYYMAIAYGYNNFKKYDPADPFLLDGQKLPYKSSRKAPTGSIKIYEGTPHIPLPQAGGTIINSQYGDGPEITRIEGTGNGGNVLDFTAETEGKIMSGSPWTFATPTYQAGKGPVKVKVIDPFSVPPADFELKFVVISNRIDSARWLLTNLSETNPEIKTVSSETTIGVISGSTFQPVINEQIIPQWGISVQIQQVYNPGKTSLDPTNGYLEATMAFTSDSAKRWLTGFKDVEGSTLLNWVRSGTFEDPDDVDFNDYKGKDDKEVYENIGVPFFAPYTLTSFKEHGPSSSGTVHAAKLDSLKSIDVVITNDKSKWTRCAVIENQIQAPLAQGGVTKNTLRSGNSVDKEGNPDGSGTGMSWFPGYAICLETGDRLNMAFSEDSWLAGENGADMLWNPSSTVTSDFGEIRLGGKHYIYVFNNERGNSGNANSMPAYDEGAFLKQNLGGSGSLINAYKSTMWVGLPLLEAGFKQLDYKATNVVESDVRIRLRVSRSYGKFNTTGENKNNDFPLYNFGTHNLAADTMNAMAAELALSIINVVPNPYYAFSEYERNQLENIIKIVNLPQNCVISIYTLNGTLIKTINKGDPSTSVNWDLKNFASVPIASGIYLIHVNVPGVGERTLKWVGIMRPVDLDAF